MNRLKQYLDDEEPLMPEGDYWVVETRSAYWIVSADTARDVERVIVRLWRPRWLGPMNAWRVREPTPYL